MAKFKLITFIPDFPFTARLWRIAVQPNGCWDWQGCLNQRGYGIIHQNHEEFCTHRIAYWLYYGIDPADKCVCHSCDNRKCINPFHLWLGTRSDNTYDMVSKNRHKSTGSQNPSAKLTEIDVLNIRHQYQNSTITQTTLGKQFGVSQAAIGHIVRRQKWQHI